MTHNITSIQRAAAKEFIQVANRLLDQGSNEQVMRDHLTSSLYKIFPDAPTWIAEHVRGGEAALKTHERDRTTTSFVDNLIGLTPIEYEGNLLVSAKFDEGYKQVQKYCASLLNDGNEPSQIIGILSDTLRWHAYSVRIKSEPHKPLEGTDVVLQEIESIDSSGGADEDIDRFIGFLLRFLQRLGSRPLNAFSIAHDLGFESLFCNRHIVALNDMVQEVFAAKPEYADLIKSLWCSFVSSAIARGKTSAFDIEEYTRELYILTLGKLICANAIEGKSLVSSERELGEIIGGDFFRNRGLENFVEYDYFGWLNKPGDHQTKLIPVAKEIQRDLRAYDFSLPPTEDIFGRLMAQLSERSQRILLGQEWTPTWLARSLVQRTIDKLPQNTTPRFVDMCCGSGTMIFEVIKQTRDRIEATDARMERSKKIDLLVQAITGFDIDPLAVMLSKITWVFAAKDWLEPFGEHRIIIPIYHADSLFATTPLSKQVGDQGEEVTLHLADHKLKIPFQLISAGWQGVFDSIIDRAYDIATHNEKPILTQKELLGIIEEAVRYSPAKVSEETKNEFATFLSQLVEVIYVLNKEGRNGIWAFMLRNSFRPALVAGQFNGLVSNPPWLALSKVADNPYKEALKVMAQSMAIRPHGPSFLHLEMSTIFLLRSVARYLQNDAVIGCVVPEAVLNGHQHNPFRLGEYARAARPTPFSVEEIWKVDEVAFKNRAAILFGNKRMPTDRDTIPGQYISHLGTLVPLEFHRVNLGPRTVWTDRPAVDASELFHPADFEQGADIMPRRLFFYEVGNVTNPDFVSLANIQEGASDYSFLISDAKQCKNFRLPMPCVVTRDRIFPVILSKMLSPFLMADPVEAFLPIKRNDEGEWASLTKLELTAHADDANALRAFTAIGNEIAQLDQIPPESIFEGMWNRINFRNKIGKQSIIGERGFLVCTGAGGSDVCASIVVPSGRLLLDQTLYWTLVDTEEEALYLVGLLNSDAANDLIKAFQPRGRQGERHVHELAFGITPPFDNSQQSHIDVVNLTRTLLEEYRSLIAEKQRGGETDFLQWLSPEKNLARRRSKLRDALRLLPAYDGYAAACCAVYGV